MIFIFFVVVIVFITVICFISLHKSVTILIFSYEFFMNFYTQSLPMIIIIGAKGRVEKKQRGDKLMKNQGAAGKFTQEIHPFGVVTLIPLVSLVEAFKVVSEDEDEFEDCPELSDRVEHIQHFFSESRRPLCYFSIYFHPLNDNLVIRQFFPDTPPSNHIELLVQKLQRCADIVGDAGKILDKYVEFDARDSQACKDFITKSLVSSYDATLYFIKYMQSQGDDTAFDYHGSYTEIILETLVEFLR